VRYRNLRMSLAAFAPALLSAGVTVFVLFLLGLPLSLLGLTALLMILSIGVDYGVFLTESVHERADQPSGSLHATLAGLFVAWFSTVFGFGVLALSQQPALRIIGVVAAVGVTSALLLAPTALSLLRPAVATRRRA
jgi:predicted exporter